VSAFTVSHVAPILPVRDVVAALARYRRLGFEVRAYIEPPLSTESSPIYGYLRLGDVEIHLSAFSALDPTNSVAACYLFVDDADAVFAAWSVAGVEGTLRPPTDTRHGKRELSYRDPDGNLLRVGSPRPRG